MPQTVRKFWPDPFPFGQRAILNFNWDAIDSDSVVVVTASAYVPLPNPPPGTNLQRGTASPFQPPNVSVRVDTVSPHGPPYDANHGVTFSIEIDIDDDENVGNNLFVATDITVLDDKPVEIQD